MSYIIDTVARGKYILPGNDLNVFIEKLENLLPEFLYLIDNENNDNDGVDPAIPWFDSLKEKRW